MIGLSPSQSDCARCSAEMTDALERPPTMRELANEMDFCHASGAYRLMAQLRERGWCAPHGPIALTCPPPLSPPEMQFEITESGVLNLCKFRGESSGK